MAGNPPVRCSPPLTLSIEGVAGPMLEPPNYPPRRSGAECGRVDAGVCVA
jgi:hypothetical protein